MDFNTLSPNGPNLVSVIMEDRMREAAATRMAANVPAPPRKSPRWFSRFLSRTAHRQTQTARVATTTTRS
jgi:hypothetical protein